MIAYGSYYLERAFRALELLATQPLSAPQVAEVLQVDPRTARRMLRRLQAEQYLDCSGDRHRRYQPTLRLVALAGQILEHTQLVQRAIPYVQHLHDRTGGTAHLAIPSYQSVLCVVHAAEGWPAHAEVRELMPSHRTATGRVLLAYRHAWRESILHTPASAHPNPGRLQAELDDIRRSGYATETNERHSGEHSVAAPVIGGGGEVIAALGVSISGTADVGSLGEMVTDAAQRLTGGLGSDAH